MTGPLYHLRQRLGLSKAAMALALGITRDELEEWEHLVDPELESGSVDALLRYLSHAAEDEEENLPPPFIIGSGASVRRPEECERVHGIWVVHTRYPRFIGVVVSPEGASRGVPRVELEDGNLLIAFSWIDDPGPPGPKALMDALRRGGKAVELMLNESAGSTRNGERT